MRSNFCATRALASGLPVATKRWVSCCKNGRRVRPCRPDGAGLLAGEGDARRYRHAMALLQFYLPVGTQEAFDLANVRATRRLGNGPLPGACVTLFISRHRHSISTITTTVTCRKISALLALPVSLPAARRPAKRSSTCWHSQTRTPALRSCVRRACSGRTTKSLSRDWPR